MNIERLYKRALEILFERYGKCNISLNEILVYISAPTYTGDTITIEEISENIYLLFHELVEVCELKKMGFEITKDIIMKHPIECYKAHYVAIEKEIELAYSDRNIGWVKKRLRDVELYLSDPNLPVFLRDKFKDLLKRYSSLINNRI